MPDDQPDYIRFAGRVAFPRGPQDLVGTNHCPACFTIVSGPTCAACGLDLGNPAAAELYDASLTAAAALERRLSIIGRIRYETAQAATRAQAQITVTPEASEPTPAATIAQASSALSAPFVAPGAAPPISLPALAAHTQATVPSTPQSLAPVPAPVAVGEPRRSSVQVTLLVVGVSLLSIAAIFFLVYAFINFGIVWRSVIIGAITVAALVTASVLRRRALRATAEGIAAFAVVLVYLDAYALRANNMFGLAAVDGAVYWGTALLLTAVAFLAWHRGSGLRIPNIAGFATFAPGAGVLVGGLTQHLPEATQGFVIAGTIAGAGLIHGIRARDQRPITLERTLVLCTTVLALLVGLLYAFFLGLDSPTLFTRNWAPTLGVLAVVVVAALHILVLSRNSARKVENSFAYVLSAFAAVAAASAVGFAVPRIDGAPFVFLAPTLAAAFIALVLEAAAWATKPAPEPDMPSPIGPTSFWYRNFTTGMWSAVVVAGVAIVAPLTAALVSAGYAASDATASRWRRQPADLVAHWNPDSGWAVAALAAVTLLAALIWALTGRLRSRSVALASAVAVVAVTAIPELQTQAVVMGAWMLLGISALAALLVLRGRPAVRTGYRALLIVTMSVSVGLGYLLAWATTPTWWIGTVIVLAVLVACRPLVIGSLGRAVLLGAALIGALASVGVIADLMTLGTVVAPRVALANTVVLIAVAAVIVFFVAAFGIRHLSSADRQVTFWTSGAFATGALMVSAPLMPSLGAENMTALLLPEFTTSLAVSLVALLALALWMLLPANKLLRTERIVAAIAVGPALYLVFTAFARVLILPQFVAGVAPITGALFAAVGALAIATLRPSTTPRWARELGVAVVGLPTVLHAFSTEDPLAWLVLFIAAIATLLLATDASGLFASSSARRQLGWLALALATAGLWWQLDSAQVTDLAAYVVPLTLALLLVAALIQRAAVRALAGHNSRVAPLVTFGGLLVSMVPLGINEATGPTFTFGFLLLIAVVLLIGGSAIVASAPAQWTADAMAATGALAVIVMAGTRAAALPILSPERDVWLATAFLALAIAAFLQARPRSTGSPKTRATVSQWLGIAAITLLLAVESAAFGDEVSGSLRAGAVVTILAAVHVIAYLVNRAPLSHLLAWVAIGYSAVAGALAYLMDALDPVEFASVPIALALIITAILHLAANPQSGSWARLGPATAVLLLPSLISTGSDPAPWRLVGLGVVGIAVIVAALVRGLQAPFVIGVVVVLWHGIATFLPQLRAAYEFFPWWLWLGVGGVLLIVLAARYERRIRDLKNVATKFAALR